MSRRVAFMTATIGSIALVLGGMSAEVYAQNGVDGGRGSAPSVGQGRASTAGRPASPFDELKAKMLEGNGMSLGEAIHALDPKADATAEAQTAERQADADLKAAGKTK